MLRRSRSRDDRSINGRPVHSRSRGENEEEERGWMVVSDWWIVYGVYMYSGGGGGGQGETLGIPSFATIQNK